MTAKVRGFEVAKGFEDKEINLPKRSTKHSAGYDFEAAEDVIIPALGDIQESVKKEVLSIAIEDIFGVKGFTDPNNPEKLQELMKQQVMDMEPMEQIEFALNLTRKIESVADIFGRDIFEKDKLEIADTISETDFAKMEVIGDWLSEETKTKIENAFKKLKPKLIPTGIKAYMQDGEFLKMVNRSSNPLKRFLVLSNGVGIIDADYYNNPDNDGHIMVQFINFGTEALLIQKGDRIAQGIFLPYLLADDDAAEGVRQGGHGSTD